METTADTTVTSPSTSDTTTGDTESNEDSTTSVAECGNGVVEAREACDDGVENGGYGSCREDCSGLGPHCGDGRLEPTREQCDDGNPDQGDGCNVDCLESGALIWELRLPTVSGAGSCGGLAVTADSEAVVSTNGQSPRVVKLTPEGTQAWSVEFNDASAIADDPTVSPAGDVIGIATAGPTILVSQWSSEGDAVWSREYQNLDANGYASRAGGVVSDADGSVLAVGARAQAQGNVMHDIFLRRYSSRGDVFWTEVLPDNALDDYANAVDVSTDGGYYVACGARGDGSGERVPWVGAVTYESTSVWTHFDSDAAYGSEYFDIAVAPDGSVVVAGETRVGNEDAILIARLTPDGDEEWSRSVDSFDGVDEHGLGIAASRDGSVLVAGSALGGWLGKFTADGGTLLWTMTQADADGGFLDVEVDPSDAVFVCGARPSEGGLPINDVWVAKLTP